MRTSILFVFVLGLPLGCGSSSELPPNPGADAATDGRSDAGVDADARAEADVGSQGDVSSESDAGTFDASDSSEASEADRTDAPLFSDATDAAEGDTSDATACTGWSYWDEGLEGGNITIVRFDPRTPGVAFGAAGAQLYRSTNSGQTWSLVTNNTGAAIVELAFPSNAPNALLAATGGGLRRSDDGGQTWTPRGLQGVPLMSLLVDRSSPQRIFVGGEQGLLMRSTDGGTTWRSASSGVPFGQVTSIVGDPTNPDNVVASVILEDANGVVKRNGATVRSTNGGMSWATGLTVNEFAWRVSQCPADPKIMYASTGVGVFKSNDGGASWGPQTLTGTTATDVGIDASNCDHIYASIFPAGVAKSMNGGTTWSAPITSGLTLQEGYQYAIALAVDPKDGVNVLAATHNGIFRSTNGGDNWSAAAGIKSVLCRDLRVSPAAPQELWMASWGSGAWRRASPTAAWQRIPLDKLPREWMIAVYPDTFVSGRLMVGAFLGGGDAWRSADNGTTFQVTNASSLNPFVFATDPVNNSVMYMGTQLGGVYKSIDGGVTWQPSNAGATNAFVLSILIASDDGRTIYIGTQGNGILRSTDAGASWNATTMGVGAGDIWSLVQFNGFLYAWVDGAGIYRSQDGIVWTPSNSGLDDLTTGGIVVDSAVPRLIAIAGSGVFTSADGTAWIALDKGCPPPNGGGRPVIVSEGGSRYLVLGAGNNGAVSHRL